MRTGPSEGRICQASLNPHADRLEAVSLRIIVLETYGHLNSEEYLWLSGLVIEVDHSKSAPAVVVSTAWEKIKLVSWHQEKPEFTAQNNTVTDHISQAKQTYVCVLICVVCYEEWYIDQYDYSAHWEGNKHINLCYEGQVK